MKVGDIVECVKSDDLGILEIGKNYIVSNLVKLGAYHNYESQISLFEVPHYLWKMDKFIIVSSHK